MCGNPAFTIAGMYPASQLLEEVGRVAIAGSRLEVRLGRLWAHLAWQEVEEQKARKAPVGKQLKEIRRLANDRLAGKLLSSVLAATESAKNAAERRNEVVHQDWVLRGPHSLRSIADLPKSHDEIPAYIVEWEREAKPSDDWLSLPARSTELVPAQTWNDLVDVERELAVAGDAVQDLVFPVASARLTGSPAGWISPEPPRPQPLPPGWIPVGQPPTR
jgi:hypothetical protein